MKTHNTFIANVEQFIKENKNYLTYEDLEEIIKNLAHIRSDLKENEREKIMSKQIKKSKQKTSSNGKTLYIKRYTRRIAAHEYYGNQDIVKVVLNPELREIGEFAFAGCTNLREIEFPDGLISLRKGCFKNCISLKSLTLPDISNIYPSAFEGCHSLEKVFIPSTVTNIYSNAFKNCSSLYSVVFEEKGRIGYSATRIFKSAFENCILLPEITVYNASIDKNAFFNCEKLKKITLYGRWKHKINLENCDANIIWK